MKFEETIGIDIGIKDVCSISDKTEFKKDIHNHSLETIQQKLARKKKGSKSFKKAQKHRSNYIKWYMNQINFDNVHTLKMEDIKNLRKNKRTNRYMSHWTYTEIKDKLESLALTHGVHVVKVSPVYTSQRCSECGWTHKDNRKGKCFVCKKCNKTLDADYNASLNISFTLPREKWQSHKNRKGFYWNEIGKEPIVSSVQKVK